MTIQIYFRNHRFYAFVIAYMTVFFLLAVFGYYASGKVNEIEHAFAPSRHRFMSDMGFYALPSMTIAMSTGGNGGGATPPRLRVEVVLEVASKDSEIISGYQPRMTEKINAYMLKLKPEDLQRKNALTWLRGELLQEVNSVGAPVPVHGLYFQQFLMM